MLRLVWLLTHRQIVVPIVQAMHALGLLESGFRLRVRDGVCLQRGAAGRVLDQSVIIPGAGALPFDEAAREVDGLSELLPLSLVPYGRRASHADLILRVASVHRPTLRPHLVPVVDSGQWLI